MFYYHLRSWPFSLPANDELSAQIAGVYLFAHSVARFQAQSPVIVLFFFWCCCCHRCLRIHFYTSISDARLPLQLHCSAVFFCQVFSYRQNFNWSWTFQCSQSLLFIQVFAFQIITLIYLCSAYGFLLSLSLGLSLLSPCLFFVLNYWLFFKVDWLVWITFFIKYFFQIKLVYTFSLFK